MASPFKITSHTFAGQHIREYPHALASSQEDTVQLHANSYVPHEVADGRTASDLTIVAFHANAFHKEVYEPFFEALYRSLKEHSGLHCSIWIADQAAQGSSALLNETTTGNDPSSWFDHSRDVLAMCNTFRQSMKRPIVAVGHSMGGTQAVGAAHMHPRLFEAVVIIDAPIGLGYAPSLKQMLQYAFHRPESHESREELEKAVSKSPLFKGWDPRVVRRYIETGFHSAATVTVPNGKIKPKTRPHVEASTMVRANLDHHGINDGSLSDAERALFPNVNADAPLTSPVYSPYPREAYSFLPSLRPSALFLHAAGSLICRPEDVVERTRITGTATGGSGGEKAGKVKTVEVEGGHFAPMVKVEGTAECIAGWVGEQVKLWREKEREVVGEWEKNDMARKQRVDPEVERALTQWNGKPWPKGEGVSKRGPSRL